MFRKLHLKAGNEQGSPSFTMLHRLTAILDAKFLPFRGRPLVGNVVSHPGVRAVILTDRLRIGKG